MLDFYFTGVVPDDELVDYIEKYDTCILLSQLNDRSNIAKWIAILQEKPNLKLTLFIDSGAFSAWTKGKVIDVDEYIDFLNKNEKYFHAYASVDNIPGQPRTAHIASQEEVEASAQKTWENYLYMRKRLNDPSKLIYTYHAGEPEKFLINALEYKDEKGPIGYLAIGGLVGKSDSVLDATLNRVFKIIRNSSNPNIRLHAFGMTRMDYMTRYEFTSVDSTSWLMTATYGSINVVINDKLKTLYVSDRNTMAPDHLLNQSPAVKEEVEKICREVGENITLDDLLYNDPKGKLRSRFNLYSFNKWRLNFKPNKLNKEVCDLW